jgi:hypothetical protein
MGVLAASKTPNIATKQELEDAEMLIWLNSLSTRKGFGF